jgi:hypothetical protein
MSCRLLVATRYASCMHHPAGPSACKCGAVCLHLLWAVLCHCCLQDFPPLPEDGRVLQRNEGKWDFTLEESEDG